MRVQLKHLLLRLLAIVALLLVWGALGNAFSSVRLMMSTPGRILQFILSDYEIVIRNALYTLGVSAGGFVAACAIGLITAVLSYRSLRFSAYAVRVLQAIQVVPVLVFAPFITIVLDVGPAAHIFIAFLVGLFPFVTLLIDALIGMPSALVDLIRMYKIPFGPAVTKVYLPFIAPAIFAAARVSATLCVVGATVAEFTGSRYGLGKSVFEAAIRIEPEKMVISTLGIILIGLFYIKLIKIAEHRIVKWQH